MPNAPTQAATPRRGVRSNESGIRSDRTPRSGVAARVVCLILILLPAVAAGQIEGRDHVVVVLDTSGSMASGFGGGRSKMDVAKDALAGVVRGLPGRTHLGLAAFGTGRPGLAFDLGPPDVAALTEAVVKLRPRGSTPLGPYLEVAADRLLAERAANNGYGTYRLLIVSDGEADDPARVERALSAVLARGLRVDVIGVAMDGELGLARRVHSYRRADDPAALRRGLADVLGEVASSADTGGAGSFATLAPLPAAAAGPMLTALAQGDDRPVGQASTPPRPAPRVAFDGEVVLLEPATPSWASIVVGTCGGGLLILVLFVIIIAATFGRALRR